MFKRSFAIIALTFAFAFVEKSFGAATMPAYSINAQAVPADPSVAKGVRRPAVLDYNGDGKTDYTVVRNTGGGPDGQVTWFTKLNDGNPTTPFNWGIASDIFLSGDFDGDRKSDITVWRPSNATFYILQSQSLTVRLDQLGQDGDDPTVVGDYDGDGKDDVAVYRPGVQSRWFYRTNPTAFFTATDWGRTGDYVAPGDYDGDRKADFVIYRAAFGNGSVFKRLSTGTFSTEDFGFPGSLISVVPGDYDGDGKTDISVWGLTLIGNWQWHFEPSGTPGITRVSDVWGEFVDIPVQGDYTGDGKTDYAVWRPSNGTFYIMTVTGEISTTQFGQIGDLPVGNSNAHDNMAQ